jgi:hypothetical protein
MCWLVGPVAPAKVKDETGVGCGDTKTRPFILIYLITARNKIDNDVD